MSRAQHAGRAAVCASRPSVYFARQFVAISRFLAIATVALFVGAATTTVATAQQQKVYFSGTSNGGDPVRGSAAWSDDPVVYEWYASFGNIQPLQNTARGPMAITLQIGEHRIDATGSFGSMTARDKGNTSLSRKRPVNPMRPD